MRPLIPTFPVPLIADSTIAPGSPDIVIIATVILAVIDLCRLAILWYIQRGSAPASQNKRPRKPAE